MGLSEINVTLNTKFKSIKKTRDKHYNAPRLKGSHYKGWQQGISLKGSHYNAPRLKALDSMQQIDDIVSSLRWKWEVGSIYW